MVCKATHINGVRVPVFNKGKQPREQSCYIRVAGMWHHLWIDGISFMNDLKRWRPIKFSSIKHCGKEQICPCCETGTSFLPFFLPFLEDITSIKLSVIQPALGFFAIPWILCISLPFRCSGFFEFNSKKVPNLASDVGGLDVLLVFCSGGAWLPDDDVTLDARFNFTL